MRTLLLSLVLSATAAYGQRVTTPSDDGVGGLCGGRAARTFRAPNGGPRPLSPFCDRFAAGDKTGNWFCLNGDGTMSGGSQVTLSPVASPGTDTSTCVGSVMSFTNVGQSYTQTPSETFPASSLTVCAQLTYHTFPAGLEAFGFGGGAGTPAVTAILPCEVQADGTCKTYTSDGLVWGTSVSTTALVVDVPSIVCVEYTRVGGAANNVITQYFNGAGGGTSSTHRLIQALSSGWALNGPTGIGWSAMKSDGMFVTYKLLGAARIAAVSAPLCQ